MPNKKNILSLDITIGSTSPTQIAIVAKQLAVMLRWPETFSSAWRLSKSILRPIY